MPVKIFGLWDEGYVIDNYIVSSRYIGEDPFGFRQFDTTYTEIGKLLHAMKYNGHFDTSERIVDYCYDFLKQWLADKTIEAIAEQALEKNLGARGLVSVLEKVLLPVLYKVAGNRKRLTVLLKPECFTEDAQPTVIKKQTRAYNTA